MTTCDVLVVGGGPAGSSCASALVRAGFDVLVLDRAVFPRDKVCAGWITPQVVDDLALDIDDYRRGRVFQPITGFRTGVIGSARAVETVYNTPVSYGIRRCEFDHYLLQRSGARLAPGTPLSSLSFDHGRRQWLVNGEVETPMIVGAGGHFCPVARWLNPASPSRSLVAAQEAEFALAPGERASWAVDPALPELYFARDLSGYGWCFRKESFVNVGFGRIGGGALPAEVASFSAFLAAQHRTPAPGDWRWRGHAYLVSEGTARQTVGDAVLLAGDAAGLANPQSGEGIRPAIESGLMAADAIQAAGGHYSQERLAGYARHLTARFRASPVSALMARIGLPAWIAPLVPRLIDVPLLARHVLLDRMFLQAYTPPLRRGPEPALQRS